MLLYTFAQMLDYVIGVISTILTIYVVMSMLIAFNVINTRNDVVVQIYRGLTAFFEPVLGPIRRAMPQGGGIDFSPIVLIVLLKLVSILFNNLARTGY